MKLISLGLAGVVLGIAALVIVQGYAGRVALRDSQVAGCERAVEDRIVHRDQAIAASRGNWIVADDKAQPAKTRLARRDEAAANDRAVLSFESRMPRTDRRTKAGRRLPEFSCARAVPPARVLGT